MTDRKDIDTIVGIINAARANGLGDIDIADAVLAAIESRLLPEMPGVIGEYRIVGSYQITPNNDETWSVMVWDDADDLIVDGTASTPALAIRAALEADQ